jgi:hypothetical protein
MDCPISNNGTVFGIHDWLNYLLDQAPSIGNLSSGPMILSLKRRCALERIKDSR